MNTCLPYPIDPPESSIVSPIAKSVGVLPGHIFKHTPSAYSYRFLLIPGTVESMI